MPAIIDQALGIHARALQLRSRRGELLASNLANADTPNYKARDLDFRKALSDAQSSTQLTTTAPGHIATQGGGADPQTMYRVPNQSSLDGNTVDSQIEQTRFAENAVRYRASLRFLSGRISSLMTAIKGD
jgi:flagellar basal-body rod protein FlgB